MSRGGRRGDETIERLGNAASSLLEACAVLGESFTFSQLLAILGEPGEHGTARFVRLSGWAELRNAEIIVADDPARPESFRFGRVADRDWILSRLPEAERERIEARLAASTLGGTAPRP